MEGIVFVSFGGRKLATIIAVDCHFTFRCSMISVVCVVHVILKEIEHFM